MQFKIRQVSSADDSTGCKDAASSGRAEALQGKGNTQTCVELVADTQQSWHHIKPRFRCSFSVQSALLYADAGGSPAAAIVEGRPLPKPAPAFSNTRC